MLERDGHTVTVACTGPDAIRLAAEEDHALVVLDLVLPGLSGLDVLRAMLIEQPSQRVLMLSAIGDAATKVECFQNGAVGYLAKPFAVAELVARVRVRASEPRAPAFQRWLTAGELHFDKGRPLGPRVTIRLPLATARSAGAAAPAPTRRLSTVDDLAPNGARGTGRDVPDG